MSESGRVGCWCGKEECAGEKGGVHLCGERGCWTRTQGGQAGWEAHMKVVHGGGEERC